MGEKDFTGHNSALTPRAQALRKNMTRQERKLWYDYLRSYPVKFYRQRCIDHFIADFYCSKAHLVIEIDGGQHYMPEGMEYDKYRTSVIETYKLEVVRFNNLDIDQNFRGVCEYLDRKIPECVHKWSREKEKAPLKGELARRSRD